MIEMKIKEFIISYYFWFAAAVSAGRENLAFVSTLRLPEVDFVYSSVQEGSV